MCHAGLIERSPCLHRTCASLPSQPCECSVARPVQARFVGAGKASPLAIGVTPVCPAPPLPSQDEQDKARQAAQQRDHCQMQLESEQRQLKEAKQMIERQQASLSMRLEAREGQLTDSLMQPSTRGLRLPTPASAAGLCAPLLFKMQAQVREAEEKARQVQEECRRARDEAEEARRQKHAAEEMAGRARAALARIQRARELLQKAE